MKSKKLSQVVAVIGLIALSVTIARAGNGPGITSFSAFFECQNVNGAANVNEPVTIGDPTLFSQFPIQHAVVGKTVLACKQVQVRDTAGNPFNPAGPPTGDVLKCYSISVQGPAETPETFTFLDFFGSEVNRVQGSRFLCGTATRSQ